jgi:hypothetical protein
MRVGIIGLGRMGAGMAANLLHGGHEVVVYNRTPAKAEALIAQGAKAVADVSDACRGDAVVTMLADDSAVEGIVLGGGGVIDSLRAGALHVSSSTISVALVGKDVERSCESRPTLRRRSGVRPSRCGGCGTAVHRRCRRTPRGRSRITALRSHGPEDVRRLGNTEDRQPGEAQRQFPDRLGDRSARRGDGARRQGRSRSATVS